MSKPKTDLENLLSNIQKGLKEFSIKELNEAIILFLNKKSDKSIEINYILEIVASEYNISVKKLKAKHSRGLDQEAKQIAYCLLHLDLDLSTRYISRRIFMNNHNSLAIGIRKLKQADKNHKIDLMFIKKYELLKSKFINNFSNLNKLNCNESI